MALEINLVNLGTYPNDGSGDDLRTAFEKVNANFESLEDNVVLSAVNLGTGAPLYSDKLGNDLRFRSLKSLNSKLSVSYDSNEISLAIATFLERIEEDTNPRLGGNLDLNSFEINGTGDIDINGVVIADGFEGVLLGTVFGDLFGNVYGNVTGNVTGQVSDLSNHLLSSLADVSTQTPNVNEALVWNGLHWFPSPIVTKIIAGPSISVTPTEGTGEVTLDVTLTPVTSLPELTDVEITDPAQGDVLQYDGTSWKNSNLTSYDFGLLSGVRNQFDLLFQFTSVDFGSLNNPSTVTFDLGFIDVEIPEPEVPTYSLASNLTSVAEGGSVTITLTTTNVADGTVIPYVITGVTSNDINGTSLTGSFVVTDGTASLTIPITLDFTSESETLTLSLLGIAPLVSVSVDIEDYVLPDNIDGGLPSTTSFESIIDGGLPSTTSFEIEIEGELVVVVGLLPTLISGGSPSDTSDVILDGESPSTTVSVVVDGGTL